jgi:hypothetical protein
MRNVGKGKPKRGFRMTRKRRDAIANGYKLDKAGNIVHPKTGEIVERLDGHTVVAKPLPVVPIKKESEAERERKISKRFHVLETLCDASISGAAKALIVSGPPGLSKSYTVEQKLKKWNKKEDNFTIIKGYVRATGLYKVLWQNRTKGRVIVFDDADSIFTGSDAEVSINLLKAVLDTTEKRIVSYRTKEPMYDDENACTIDESFEFEGTCIFITNYDFDEMVDRGNKLSDHLGAIRSRAHYVDLAMKSREDFMTRIRQVCRQGMLKNEGLSTAQEKDVLTFIEKNKERCRELSLRTALKVGALRKFNKDWKDIAEVTCLRNI